MIPELLVIHRPEQIRELLTYLQDKDVIAYDCETTGLTSKHEVIGFSICAEENKAWYVILAYWDNEAKKLIYHDNRKEADEVIQALIGKKLIMHNGIFDCMMAEAFFKVRLIESLHTDTMLLAHFLNENRLVGLKELAKSMYGESSVKEEQEMKASVIANGGTWLKKDKEMFKADPYLLGKYGAKDAALTFKLFNDLVPQLIDENLVEFFYDDETMPLLRGPTYDLNTTGIPVDIHALHALKNTLKAEAAEAKAFVMKEVTPRIKDIFPGTKKTDTFNIDSPVQLSRVLFDIYGLEFGVLTDEGKVVCKAMNLKLPYTKVAKRTFISECKSRLGEVYQPEAIVNGKKKRAKKIKPPWNYLKCDKAALNLHAHKYEWIQKLLDYKKKTKLLGTYIEGIEERIQYGIIRPSYIQHGTKTGRYSSRNPNLQNLPRDDQRVKNCFVSRPGKAFVSADFSQLEPRVFAFYSGDKRLMSAFDGTSDFYSVVGREVYDKFDSLPLKDGHPDAFGVKYKKLRDMSKAIALAFAYGATASKIASMTGKSLDDTREDKDKYFESFPGVQKMMLEAHDLVKQYGFVTNHFGRKRRIPEAMRINKLYGKMRHEEYNYDTRSLLNAACNFRIQSTGASIVNRSIIAFYKAAEIAGINCKLVSQIHDELVIECNESDANDVSALLQYAMENTIVLEGVPLEAIPRVSKTLAK